MSPIEENTDNELERLQQLDQLRKLIQLILGGRLFFLLIVFAILLAGIVAMIYLRVTRSPTRYVARLSLHYYPKQTGKIKPYEQKFLLQLFNRPALRKNFVKALKKKEYGNPQPTGAVEVKVEKRRNSSNFSIQLKAKTEYEAVQFTNLFAKVCIKEYCGERTQDLKRWEEVLQKKKQDIFKQIHEIDTRKEKLTRPLQVVSPEKDYDRMRIGLADQQAEETKLQFMLNNLKIRQKRLVQAMAQINPKLLEQEKEIKEQSALLKQLDKEIEVAQELYTELNPKLIALISRRKQIEEKFEAFKKKNNLSQADIDKMDAADKLSSELKTITAELETKQEELRVLNGEINRNQMRFNELKRIMPHYQVLNQQTASLRDSLQKLDESIADINYMLLVVKDDLFATDQAEMAIAAKPLRKKNLAIGTFAALSLTAFAAALVVLLEFFFGKLSGEQEIKLFPEFHHLGNLPARENLFHSKIQKEMVFNSLCRELQLIKPEQHVVLTGALPGAKIIPDFFEECEKIYAMAGKEVLILDVVLADEVDQEISEDTLFIIHRGGRGHLPLASRKFFSPMELSLLKDDLNHLSSKYDLIFIRHSASLRHDRLFLEQIAPLCTGALVAVGYRKTPRKSLRMLAAAQRKTGLTFMTILTDSFANHVQKNLKMEVES